METRHEQLERPPRILAEDARRLSDFRVLAAPHFAGIAETLCERIREQGAAQAFCTGEAQIAHLRTSLVGWLERVLSGPYDDAYFEETARIGRLHVEAGLPQRYVLDAMAFVRTALTRVADGPSAEGVATREAIARLLDLELAIMLETYAESHAAQLRGKDAERQAAIRLLAGSVAHELRNPLNGAQLHASFLERALERNDADAELREAARVVGDEIRRFALRVTELLDFARPKPPC